MIKNNSSYTELNNWDPQEQSHLSSVQIMGDNLGQFLLGIHLFASPKSGSHQISLIKRDNKETKKVSLYSRRWWKESRRQGRKRQHVPPNIQEGMSPRERDTQQHTRLFRKQTGCTWSPFCCLLRLDSPDHLRFPLWVLPLPTVTYRKWGNGDETCLLLSDQPQHWEHMAALPTLPLGKWQQVPLPVYLLWARKPSVHSIPPRQEVCVLCSPTLD